jgi:hypothetical protein
MNPNDKNSISGRGRKISSFDALNPQGEMNEAMVRKIIKDELLLNANSGAPIVPRHTHDNVNSPAIQYADIISSPVFNGTIDMSQGTIIGSAPNQVFTYANYYIPIPSKVSTVQFFGGALNITASPKLHAMIIGEAELVGGYQYQPGTPNSVTMGKVFVPIVQGSSSFIVTNGAVSLSGSNSSFTFDGTGLKTGGLNSNLSVAGTQASSILRNSQGHIAYAADSSSPQNVYAVANVLSYTSTQIVIQTAFAPNWSLSGLWTIS